MMDPVGPLPAPVYWRRRLLAVVAALLGIFGLLWFLTSALLPPGVDSDDSTTGRAAHVDASPASPAQGAGLAATVAPPSAPGVPGSPAGAPPAGPSTGPAAPNAGPVDETVRPDATGRLPVLVPPAGPLPATGPPPCRDDMIRVSAESGAPVSL